MPYVYDPNLDDDENEDSGAPSGSSSQIAGGSSSGEAPIASGSSSQAAPKELKTGSGYQNLDKYLNTNQAQQFGKQVTGKVGQTIGEAKQNQSQASGDFTNKVNSANDTPDEQTLNTTLENASSSDPKQFQKWMSQSYSGPKSLGESQSDWNKYWSGTNKAQTEANALGSESGRFSLLDSYFGRPQYNFGEKSLDNLLVQKSGTGRESTGLQNQAAQLRSQGNENAKNLQGVAAQRAGQVDQSRQQVNDAYSQAQSSAQVDVNQALEAAQSGRVSEQNDLKSLLAQDQVKRDQLAKFGLNEGQNLYDLNLDDYLSANPNLTKEQVATDEQRARLNALSQLAGQSQTFLGEKQDLSDPYSFDSSRFGTDLSQRQSQYSQDLGSAMNVVKTNAPFQGSYLNTLSASSDPTEVMNKINNETAFWQNEKKNGNTFADTRLGQLQTSRDALSQALNKYKVSPTGEKRSLKVI